LGNRSANPYTQTGETNHQASLSTEPIGENHLMRQESRVNIAEHEHAPGGIVKPQASGTHPESGQSDQEHAGAEHNQPSGAEAMQQQASAGLDQNCCEGDTARRLCAAPAKFGDEVIIKKGQTVKRHANRDQQCEEVAEAATNHP